MPLYEYECRKCKAHIEVMQKMTDQPLKKCRQCGGRLEKQWSSTSFHLKGSGWYATDYAAKTAETKEERKETTEESQKPDPKPDATEEKSAKSETASASDKATPQETSPSKKKSSTKPAPSGGD